MFIFEADTDLGPKSKDLLTSFFLVVIAFESFMPDD